MNTWLLLALVLGVWALAIVILLATLRGVAETGERFDQVMRDHYRDEDDQ